MKRRTLILDLSIMLSLVAVYSAAPAMAITPASFTDQVEVAFDYQKSEKRGSNQFAVWVEDSGGNHVKTLYATRFTAEGGWSSKRENSIPAWVKSFRPAEKNKEQIDAVTSATPASGRQTFLWDGRNSAGEMSAKGEYTVFVECTYFDVNRVLYTAKIPWRGSTGAAKAEAEHFGGDKTDSGMITNVAVIYKR